MPLKKKSRPPRSVSDSDCDLFTSGSESSGGDGLVDTDEEGPSSHKAKPRTRLRTPVKVRDGTSALPAPARCSPPGRRVTRAAAGTRIRRRTATPLPSPSSEIAESSGLEESDDSQQARTPGTRLRRLRRKADSSAGSPSEAKSTQAEANPRRSGRIRRRIVNEYSHLRSRRLAGQGGGTHGHETAGAADVEDSEGEVVDVEDSESEGGAADLYDERVGGFVVPDGEGLSQRHVRCTCPEKGWDLELEGGWVKCRNSLCGVYQHAKCWGYSVEEARDIRHMCEQCDIQGKRRQRERERIRAAVSGGGSVRGARGRKRPRQDTKEADAGDWPAVTELVEALVAGDQASVKALLEEAARNGQEEELADADVGEKAGPGVSVLMHAAGLGAPMPCLRLLLKAGADAERTDEQGRTALHYVAEGAGHTDVAALLHAAAPGTLHVSDRENTTMLHLAAEKGNDKLIQWALERVEGDKAALVRLLSAKTRSKDLALHLACVGGSEACVRLLLRAYGSGAKTAIAARGAGGATPLMCAAGVPSEGCIMAVLEAAQGSGWGPLEKLNYMREKDDVGYTAVHYAAERGGAGAPEALNALLQREKLLLDSIPRPRFVFDDDGGLHCRDANGWDDGATIRMPVTEQGCCTALHLAALMGHADVAMALLAHGASSHAKDDEGWTPVMYADFKGHSTVALLLLNDDPEKQLAILGDMLNASETRRHPRVVSIMRTLATVPSFYARINELVARDVELLQGGLGFLLRHPGLLSFANKQRYFYLRLDSYHQAVLEAAQVMCWTYHDPLLYAPMIHVTREAGGVLRPVLGEISSKIANRSMGYVASWLQRVELRFNFAGEQGYGPGVSREAWELLARDLAAPPAETDGDPGSNLPGSSVPTWPPPWRGPFVPAADRVSYVPRDVWGFSDAARRHYLDQLRAVGLLLGHALYTKRVLSLHLNPVFCKVALGRKTMLADLEGLDPEMYRSMCYIRDNKGAGDLGLTFSEEVLMQAGPGQGSQSRQQIDLCLHGGQRDVTDDNKGEYLKLKLAHLTQTRWGAQAKALMQGIREVIPGAAGADLSIFNEQDVGLLLAGTQDIDVDDWARHTQWTNLYRPELREWFWRVVRALNSNDRSLLLKFTTGCSRLPVGGFAALSAHASTAGVRVEFNVVISAYDPGAALPRSATCFFQLKLPDYPTYQDLETNLLVAIRHGCEGFTFV